MKLKNSFLVIFVVASNLSIGQVNKFNKDSISLNEYHYRIDFGFSLFQFISTSFNPKYHQHFYLGLSKNNPKHNFTPNISFLWSNSNILRDSLYFGKKFILRDYYFAISLIKNNFPKKEKFNFYYGLGIGAYYSEELRPSFIQVAMKKSYGFNLVPIVGIDLRFNSRLRFFTELQMGLFSQREKSIEYNNGNIVSMNTSEMKYFIFAFVPFKFGISFIIS